MANQFTRANGYGDFAQQLLKYCTADKLMDDVYYDFECNSYGASLGKQSHIPIGDLINGATVTYPMYTPDYSLPRTGHWNNGEKEGLKLELDDMSVNACNKYGWELKLSQTDYVMLKRCKGNYERYRQMIARVLATRKKAIIDSYVPAIIVGSAGNQIGTTQNPVTNTAASYNDMWQEILVQILDTEQMCSIMDKTPDIVTYLPNSMYKAHLAFWDEKQSCACTDGIRNGVKGYTTPYGHQVHFVNDRFLPRDAATGNVLGFWVNRSHVGVVNEEFYSDWFPDRSDMWFEGEMLYDAFLLNCKAAGVIITDQKPTCPIICN